MQPPDAPGVEREPADELATARIQLAGDQTRAETALRAMRAGIQLRYRGDARGLHQLYSAIRRRIERRHRLAADRRNRQAIETAELFHRERVARHEEHQLLSRLVVELGSDYTPQHLSHRPDVAEACAAAWGPPAAAPVVVSYREVLGVLGARQWQQHGVFVAALEGRLHTRYGVFPPTRHDYVELVAEAPAASGRRVFEIGTGTGVLALLQARSGAREVIATDREPSAVECARDNARRLGFENLVRVEHCDLYPEGRADRVLFNPPWLPGKPRTLLERGIFDPDGQLLERFIAGLPSHLAEGGEGWLVLGDLAERLDLRPADHVERLSARQGLRIAWVRSKPAPRKGHPGEPQRLSALRAEETVRLFCLSANR